MLKSFLEYPYFVRQLPFIVEAAGAATPFLREAREARDTQKGEPAAYIIYSDFFLTYLLTD